MASNDRNFIVKKGITIGQGGSSPFSIADIDGLNRQTLITDGSGNVTFGNPVIQITIDTAIGTAAKTATLSGYTLTSGQVFAATFTNGNSATAITLNINGGGAVNLRQNGANTNTTTATIVAGAVIILYYDGTYFHMMGSQRTSDSNTTYTEITEAEITNGTASTLRTITGRRAQFIVTKALGTLATVATTGSYTDLSNIPSSFTPSSHTHGNITDAGAIGTTDDLVAVTTTSGVLTTASRSGIDSRATFPATAHTHTTTDITNLSSYTGLDARYYTESEIDGFTVKLTGNQTISGIKTLSDDVLVGSQNLKYPTSETVFVSSNTGNWFSTLPIASSVWHDMFRWSTPTYETSTDGVSYSSATLNKNLFSGKQNQAITVCTTTQKFARWVWTTAMQYNYANWVVLGHTYVSPSPNVRVLVEVWTGTAWSTLHDSTGIRGTAPYFYRLSDMVANHTQVRLTVENVSATTDVRFSTIRLLTSRWGDQGQGREREWPYNWDSDRNLITYGTLQVATLDNSTGDFVTTSGTGVLQKRTAAQTLGDIGAAASSHTHPVSEVSDATTVGQNLVKLTNPGAVTFLRINADNTVTARAAADFRGDIGALDGAEVSSTAPASPTEGMLWWDDTVGELFIYYDDGISQQWVSVTSGAAGQSVSDSYTMTFPADGTTLIAVTGHETIGLGNVTNLEADGTPGTGTLSYAKDGVSATGNTSFVAGEVLSVTLSGSTTPSAVSIPRTALAYSSSYVMTFQEDGTLIVAIDTSETVDLGDVMHLEADGTAGTGTLSYTKNGGAVSGSTSFASGDVLGVTLTSSTTASAVTLPRYAA